jgi:uncharacterized damage-inducible protein DinB
MRDHRPMSVAFPECTTDLPSRAAVFLAYLDYFRDTVASRVSALPEREVRGSRLSSGWTPLELVNHLTFVERRWLEWGFEGQQVDDPWGDRRDDRWEVDPSRSVSDVLAALAAQGRRTRSILARHDLAERGQPGPRWDGAPPATLERVLFHLLQEYARHAGHLDIVAELAGGPTGE